MIEKNPPDVVSLRQHNDTAISTEASACKRLVSNAEFSCFFLANFPIKKSFMPLYAKRNPKLMRHMLQCVFLLLYTFIVFENCIANQEEQISKVRSMMSNMVCKSCVSS